MKKRIKKHFDFDARHERTPGQAAGFRPAHRKTEIIRFQKTGIKITAVSFDKQLTAVFLCFHCTD
ncbi:MAG: hypothetical protein ACLUQB_00150 [Lachnospiraceae bacterium]|uniref:Uncharacterized protein n=1 Tax=Fusicatenibacter faecihominis TaxID=2881276 RepID=A0AAE3DQC5_9FIRM|nr:hypothetical protein [Fusicatenibacter faecihominis]MBR9940198.1 hypothetical protein [Lachnospiraceae bacterium Marseille-Q4251]MCC2188425.1 hypothetical protein [Fusicatenibacter faecihominis]